MEKRLNEILQLKRKFPYRKLKEPIQDGWSLEIDLIPEAQRRKDSGAMKKALDVVMRSYVTRDPKKVSAIRKNPKYSAVRAMLTSKGWMGYYYMGPEMSKIEEKKWKPLHPSVQKWFYRDEETRVLPWNGQTITTVWYHCDVPKHYLMVKTKKRMMNYVQDIDPAILSEEAELRAMLEPYWRTCGNRYNDWHERNQKIRRRHTKDALSKVKKGEISSPEEYGKLNRLK